MQLGPELALHELHRIVGAVKAKQLKLRQRLMYCGGDWTVLG